MSLATSCPSCGTVFRVVEDQLKVSEGWVRCGHCHDVFNALEGLFDLERRDSAFQSLRTVPSSLDDSSDGSVGDGAEVSRTFADVEERVGSIAPPPSAFLPDLNELKSTAPPITQGAATATEAPSMDRWPALSETRSSATTRGPVGETDVPPIIDSAGDELAAAKAEAAIARGAAPAPPDTAIAPVKAAAEHDDGLEDDPFPATALSDQLDDHVDDFPGAVEVIEMTAPPAPPDEQLTARDRCGTLVSEELPTFVREAQRRDWWSQPVAQVVLGLGVFASCLALGAQIAWHDREHLAVACSVCQRTLNAASSWLGHPLRPPVELDAVEVDNAALTQPPGTDGYRLTVQVRNHAGHEVTAPHMELSLTDAAGLLVIRRSFAPNDFRHAPALQGQEESTWVLEFQTPQRKVSGYTVAAFYP